jgi:hypothetical protein
MTTETLIKNFEKADKKEKLIKLQEMLNMIQDKLPMFGDIDTHIKNAGSEIEDATLISYYTIIIRNAEYLENQKVAQYKDFMDTLRKREQQAHDKDEMDIDNDLTNV